MKVLFFGSNGWIGNQIITILKNSKIEVVNSTSRADNKDEVEKELNEVKPTHVFCIIGRTHGTIGDKKYKTIDYLEQKGKIYENVKDNLFSPIVLAVLCQKYKIHLTYMGTGCIFEYDSKHPFGKEENGFTENDRPNFFGSSYSVVKGFTDELMHLFDNTVLNVRIRMPITGDYNERNFITKIVTYEKVCSVPNSMTVLPELLPYMVDMAMKNQTGTINLTNPGLISHNEILTMYRDIVDPKFTWKNFTVEEQATVLAAGRSNNFMETNKLSKLYPSVKNIKESIKDVLTSMASLKKN